MKVKLSCSGGPVEGVVPTHLLSPGNSVGREPFEYVAAVTVFQIFGQQNDFVGGLRAVDGRIGNGETRTPKRSIYG